MLYADSSVLVKFYFQEIGTSATLIRVNSGNRQVATSLISFAEVHAAIARKHRERQIDSGTLYRLRGQFEDDWSNLIEVVDLNRSSMASLPSLVEKFPLKAADAIQLASALWLKGQLETEIGHIGAAILEFVASDQALLSAARGCGLQVFNPEDV